MVVEALIRTRTALSTVKGFGDVVAIKPIGSPWSEYELKVFQLVKLDLAEVVSLIGKEYADKIAEIERQFTEDGVTVISNPFTVTEIDAQTSQEEIVVRSFAKINFDKLEKAEADLIKDPTVKVPQLSETKTTSLLEVDAKVKLDTKEVTVKPK